MTNAIKIHPVADLFPMLGEEELAELASSIKEQGLLTPIVLDSEGRILDGRNRHKACELAGVKPEFETYEGDDPDTYALTVNIARRHLNKGQQAMVAATALSKMESTSQPKLAAALGIAKAHIGRAVVIAESAPDLVPLVISGAQPLSEALAIAQKNRADAKTVKERVDELAVDHPALAEAVVEQRMSLAEADEAIEHAKLVENLRERSPEFAEMVDEGKLSLGEAQVAAEQRRAEKAHEVDVAKDYLAQHIGSLAQTGAMADPAAYYADLAWDAVTSEQVLAAKAFIDKFVKYQRVAADHAKRATAMATCQASPALG
jgi:ParB/RepB/Spo0J family partition protein